MTKSVDYESRRRAVLCSTINRYIKRAVPVSSEDISQEFNLSSATIRNIFSELEENGYLMHTHTSGGRIPTNKGYRYYVDFLLSQMELLDDEKNRVVKEYQGKINRFEDALETTSEIISEITRCTSIVSFLESQDRVFYKGISLILEQPEFQDHQKLCLIIKMIEDKEQLLNVINRDFSGKVGVYIGEEMGCPEVNNCSIVVSNYSLNNKLMGKLAVLGPARMEYRHVISTLEYVSGVLVDVLEKI